MKRTYKTYFCECPAARKYYRNEFNSKIIWGMDAIKKKKNKNIWLAHILVKIDPIELPRPHRESFTKQYPLKGGHKEIEKIMELLKEGIIIPGMSPSFNSPIWPVLKPSGQYRLHRL